MEHLLDEIWLALLIIGGIVVPFHVVVIVGIGALLDRFRAGADRGEAHKRHLRGVE